MTATDPWGLSRTAASNTTIGGVSAAEGILPANLNNIDRANAAGLAELVYVLCGAITSAGTADAQTVTTSLSWASYAAGKMVAFKAGAALTNTGACTLAVDGLAAKSVKDNAGSALAAGAITAGGIYLCAYEATADVFLLLNPYSAATTAVTAASTITDNAVVRGDGGARGIQLSVILADDATGTTYPTTNDSGALGKAAQSWSDLFLASGAVINFANGDVTITHSSGLLTISDPVSIGTANALTAGSVELGDASDTTLTRSSAGVLAVESVVVPTISSTNTLTNKTLTDPAIVGAILEDIYTISDGAAFEIDPSNGTLQRVTLGAARTPAATNFANGESVTLMVDDGTAYAITWTTVGVVWIGGTAPTLQTSGWTIIELWKEGNVIRGALVGAAAS